MTSYKKMILRNTLTICLLFSLLFTVSLYMEQYRSAEKDYRERALKITDDIMNRLNASSSQLQDLSLLFQENEDFKTYIENTDASPYTKHNVNSYLYDIIASLSSTNGLISITRFSDDTIITHKSVMNRDYFYKSYGLYDIDIDNVLNEALNKPFQTPYSYFTSANGKKYFFTFLVNNTSFSEPYVIFTIDNFEKYLTGLDKDALILLTDRSYNPLFASDQLTDRDISNIINDKFMLKYSIVASQEKTFNSLGRLNMFIVMPKTKYIGKINNHIYYMLISFAVLFFLSLFISQKVSNKTYLPVQQLVSQISSLDSGTLENEFDAISSFISLLKSRNTNLTRIVASSKNELKEKFINDLLHGRLTEKQTADGISSYLENSRELLPIAIIITECSRDIAAAVREDDTASSLNIVINSLFSQEFENEGFFHFTVISPTIYCILVSCRDLKTLKERVKKLLLRVETDLNFDMFSSVSDYIDDWHSLPGAFLTAYFAHTTLKSQDISQKVYSEDEINNPVLYSYKIDNEIFSHCLRRERELLENSIDILVKENFSSDEEFAERLSQMSVLVFALCMRILTSINADSEAVFGKEYNIYLELRSCGSAEEFRKLLSFIFESIINHIENAKAPYKQNYQDEMIKFVNDNYSSKISLADLAKHMNMSQAYVSKLFKKLTDSNFKDYLAKVRVEQAKKLLAEHPEKSIRDISALVGFYTPATFSSVFAELTGMTPTEYRRVHKKK